MARKCGDSLSVGEPLLAAEKARTLVQRRGGALNAVGHLAVDHDPGAIVREKIEMRADCTNFVFCRATREPARVPAGNELEPVLRKHFPQCAGLARKLVAELEALIADRLAFAQSDFERGLAAQRRQVVVAPGNRIDADLDGE